MDHQYATFSIGARKSTPAESQAGAMFRFSKDFPRSGLSVTMKERTPKRLASTHSSILPRAAAVSA